MYLHQVVLKLSEDKLQSHLLLAGFLARMFITTTYERYSILKCIASSLSKVSIRQIDRSCTQVYLILLYVCLKMRLLIFRVQIWLRIPNALLLNVLFFLDDSEGYWGYMCLYGPGVESIEYKFLFYFKPIILYVKY